MSIKGKLLKKSGIKEHRLTIIEGINGSGKTTVLKQKISRVHKINNFLWEVSSLNMYKKNNTIKLVEIFNIKRLKLVIEYLYLFNIKTRKTVSKIEDLSSGQKKKLLIVSAYSTRSMLWYIDEPKSYIDELSYTLLKKVINNHITLSGKVIISKNSTIQINKNPTNKISLSRFELLTPHLSNECSTTEL